MRLGTRLPYPRRPTNAPGRQDILLNTVMLSTGRDVQLSLSEFQSRRVEAITKACRRRPVIKDVT